MPSSSKSQTANPRVASRSNNSPRSRSEELPSATGAKDEPTEQEREYNMADETQAWIPEKEGDSIEGILADVIRAWSDQRTNNGRDMDRGWYPLLRIDVGDGKVRDVHGFSTVLENRIREMRPMPGERISVTYLGVSGKTPPKGQNAPKLFEMKLPDRSPADQAASAYDALYGPSPARSAVRAPDSVPDDETLPY